MGWQTKFKKFFFTHKKLDMDQNSSYETKLIWIKK